MCGTTHLDELFKMPLHIKLKALSRPPPRLILIHGVLQEVYVVLHNVIVGFMAQRKVPRYI